MNTIIAFIMLYILRKEYVYKITRYAIMSQWWRECGPLDDNNFRFMGKYYCVFVSDTVWRLSPLNKTDRKRMRKSLRRLRDYSTLLGGKVKIKQLPSEKWNGIKRKVISVSFPVEGKTEPYEIVSTRITKIQAKASSIQIAFIRARELYRNSIQ